MKRCKSKRRSLRRQWSVDVPSSIHKKLRDVACRSKSLDGHVSKQLLLDEEHEKTPTCRRNDDSFENLGGDEWEQYCPSHSRSWVAFKTGTTQDSFLAYRDTSSTWQKMDDVQIEVDDENDLRNLEVSAGKQENYQNANSSSLLSTIDEIASRSPTKRTSPLAFDSEVKQGKYEINVPSKCARNEFPNTDADTDNDDPEGTAPDRHRRHAICEEMEKYIIINERGHSLRKYRETLIRHRVLKELCLL